MGGKGFKMVRCVSCGKSALADTRQEQDLTVAGHTFTSTLPAQRCRSCGEIYFSASSLEAFELQVAASLAKAGERSGSALKFMRKASDLRANELAELLDLAPETIYRWESGKLSIERRALALLASMVLEKSEGRTNTLDELRVLRKPKRLPRRLRLKVAV